MRSILFLSLLVSTASAALPPAVADLKAKRDAKIAEIERVYAAELDKIQRRLMADGNLQAAIEVQKELAAVQKDPFEDDPTTQPKVVTDGGDERLKPLIGVWKRDTDNGIWNISDTKGGVFNGNMPFTMTFDSANNRIAVVGATWADHLTFTPDPDVISGSTKTNGKTVRYKLKRVR